MCSQASALKSVLSDQCSQVMLAGSCVQVRALHFRALKFVLTSSCSQICGSCSQVGALRFICSQVRACMFVHSSSWSQVHGSASCSQLVRSSSCAQVRALGFMRISRYTSLIEIVHKSAVHCASGSERLRSVIQGGLTSEDIAIQPVRLQHTNGKASIIN